MDFLQNLKASTTVGVTANGSKTFTSSLNANVDFFAQVGSMRGRPEAVKQLFWKAYDENKETALRNLVHLRNIRLGGLGERDSFRAALGHLLDIKDYIALEMLATNASYTGRWDDLFYIMDHDSEMFKFGINIIQEQLEADLKNMREGESVSLLAKWIPNISAYTWEKRQMAKRIANALGYRDLGKYRRDLSSLRSYLNLIEVNLASKNYDAIDFEKTPSKAMFKYREALKRHKGDEYALFIEKVLEGKSKLNASLVMPHEIVKKYGVLGQKDPVLEATWKSLDNVIGESQENIIVVADTSASMTSNYFGSTVQPYHVAQGLAIYTAERLQGAFRNHFITFSRRPSLIQLPEKGSLFSKVELYNKYSIVDDTNIEKVYELILKTAVDAKMDQSELPTQILIISDMEFNEGVSGETTFETAKKNFFEAGYKLPSIIFWNVYASGSNLPVRFDESGVALVSGFSTNVLKSVLSGKLDSPEKFMLDTLYKKEYDFVEEGISETI